MRRSSPTWTFSAYLLTSSRDVAPYVDHGARQAHEAFNVAGEFYETEMHPRIKQGAFEGYKFVRHTAIPFTHKHYTHHAHPHVSRAWNYVARSVNEALDNHGIKGPRLPLSSDIVRS